MTKLRATYLDVDEVRRLNHWCASLRVMFNGEVPYLVGSSIKSPHWRDIDIRVLIPAKRFRQLTATLDILDLNMLLSQWGRQQTGLPIDCQVQDQDAANAEFVGEPRYAKGLLL